jgi:hypothetical protein
MEILVQNKTQYPGVEAGDVSNGFHQDTQRGAFAQHMENQFFNRRILPTKPFIIGCTDEKS